jgi:hypothetical protein
MEISLRLGLIDGKLIYAGRVGTGMPIKVLADLRRRLAACPQDIASERSAAALDALRVSPRSLARALGRAEACRRDHLFDLDGRQPLATHGLRRAAGRQAGEPGQIPIRDESSRRGCVAVEGG